MIRRVLYLLLVTVILGGLGGAIAYYAFDFKPKFLAKVILGSPRPPETIAAEPARTDTWQPQIAGIGTLTAFAGIDVTPQVSGVVEEIDFESSQDVKKGSLLVRLDTSVLEAEQKGLEVQLVNAQSDYDRKKTLADQGITPRTEVDQLRSQRDTLKANIERAKSLIAQKSIYAPWDGRVGLKSIALGSYLAAGQSIVWLQKIDPIYADFTVTEADFGRITLNQKITATFDAYPGKFFTGKIVTTDPRVANTSRAITVRAEIENPDSKLLPGMYANVQVDSGAPLQVVTVPQTAVTFSLYGDNIFVVVPAKTKDANAKDDELVIERRFVKTGGVRDGRVAIESGLQPGDKVVISGQNKIDQGSKVVVDNSIAMKLHDTTSIQ